MKAVNLSKVFSSFSYNFNKANRIVRNVRVVYYAGRYGKSVLTKINPALVCVDAVFSVLELVSSYYKYKTAKEKTIQLQMQLQTYKQELENLKLQYDEMLKTEQVELTQRQRVIDEKIELSKAQQKQLKHIYDQTGKHLEFIKDLIIQRKKDSLYDDEMMLLEQKYISAIHARLDLALLLT